MLNLEGIKRLSPTATHLAVVGFPISHSISPVFQNAALRKMSVEWPEFSDWCYHKIEAPVEALGQLIEQVGRYGFRGLNLTIPHKVEVLRFLDNIDPVAERMGAVNTVVFDTDGVTGYNTDGFGVVTAIHTELGVEITGKPVVVIGAGGASRGACVQCLESGCSELMIGNRSQERLSELLSRLRELYPGKKILGFQPGQDIPEIPEGAILINATSLGLKPEDPCPVEIHILEKVGCVYDMVYGRHIPATVAAAGDLGIPAADGLGMLVHQGARSLQIWTGKPVPVEVMREAVRTHMNSKK